MKYARLLLAALGVTLGAASAYAGCSAGLETGTGNLLSQSGTLVAKNPMVNPWVDCDLPSGFFVQSFGYFATNLAPWRYEIDGLVGWRNTSGRWDYGVRAGDYHVDAGQGLIIEIGNARGWTGYTLPLSGDATTLRLGMVLDEQHAFRGFPGVAADTVSVSLNMTLSHKLNERWTASVTGEMWLFPQKGFFPSGEPNYKVTPELDYDFGGGITGYINTTVMWNDNFGIGPDLHKTNEVMMLGVRKKF